MNDEFDGPRLRQALGRLAADEPELGFSPGEVLLAGRSRRRRTRAMAGTALAVAAVVATAVAVPATLWASGPSAAPSGQVAVSGPPSPVLAPTPTPTGSPSTAPFDKPPCERPTDDQWNAHLAYEARVRSVLPKIDGTLTSNINREDTGCSTRKANLAITRGKSVGAVSATTERSPGIYRSTLTRSPCVGAPQGACSLTRRGVVLIQVSRTSRFGAQATAAEYLDVTASWPDDTTVEVFAATEAVHEQINPQLSAVPLTEQQLIDLALNPKLRS